MLQLALYIPTAACMDPDHLCFGISGRGGPIMSNINGPPGPLMAGPFMW